MITPRSTPSLLNLQAQLRDAPARDYSVDQPESHTAGPRIGV
jgi:hypothetical protein